MSLTSFSFFVFLLITIILYYCIKPAQKYILLFASLYFYLAVSAVTKWKLCALILFIGTITYLGAIAISNVKGIWKNILLTGCLLAIVLSLIVLKYSYNIAAVVSALFDMSADFSWLKFSSVIGISYYAFSAIGYLVDVFWENQKPEKNPAVVFLFVFYFPQLISGPFSRFGEMRSQFCERHPLDYSNVTLGLRRMIWGYFKKLVISERFGIIVAAVYGNYSEYSMIGIVSATLCYAIQLYTDFSGCMDIIMGASMIFGIRLPENFMAPFFSETIQEFWQRWHITLGTWFKDYLMYPLQKSKNVQAVGKWTKKRLGKKFGKKVPFYISMVVLWIIIGIWHGGTGYYFIASAGIPCIYLIFSDFLQPVFRLLTEKLRINAECESWKWFRRVRTLLLICVCWMVVCSNGTYNFIFIVKHMATNLWNYTTFITAMETFGLTSLDILLMFAGTVVLYLSDLCVYRKETIFRVMDRQNFFIRIGLIYVEVLTIFMYGMVGTSSFIYFQF